MKIGIDIYSFDKPGENYGVGPGVYVWHLLPELFQQGAEHDYYVFTNNETHQLIPKRNHVTVIINNLPSKCRVLRVIHEQFFLPYQAWKHRLDCVHFLGNNISYVLGKRSILTVYDLMWKYYLDRGEKSLKLRYFQCTVPWSIKRSHTIITISAFVAKQLYTEFQKKHRVHPILLAPCDLPILDDQETHRYRSLYGFQYIYTVTTSMHHKNLIVLLKAFSSIKKNHHYTGKLVISGQLKGDYHKDTISFLKQKSISDDVVLTGFVSEKEKSYLYRNAEIFVYPSLYEGFGLPVLEAMSVGTPVIASHAASIPEVGGNACLYFDPHSEHELINQLLRLIGDSEMKTAYRQKGFEQYKKFNWAQVAKETLNIYTQYCTRR
jgi:glycosyltransferase involved in cell wall biosynthesis